MMQWGEYRKFKSTFHLRYDHAPRGLACLYDRVSHAETIGMALGVQAMQVCRRAKTGGVLLSWF
jgi:hypothetical protein